MKQKIGLKYFKNLQNHFFFFNFKFLKFHKLVSNKIRHYILSLRVLEHFCHFTSPEESNYGKFFSSHNLFHKKTQTKQIWSVTKANSKNML